MSFLPGIQEKKGVTGARRTIFWQLRKGKGGPKKNVATGGYFCHNEGCEYLGITEEETHALMGYGRNGMHENIPEFKCQVCGKKFTARGNTLLYRLKSHSRLVGKMGRTAISMLKNRSNSFRSHICMLSRIR